MTNHDRLNELVPLYALDSLEGDELHAMRGHLDACDACVRELARYSAVMSNLVPDEPAPPHVWERIATAIGNREAITFGRAADGKKVDPRQPEL
jgi:anti-sigma factor RsiW